MDYERRVGTDVEKSSIHRSQGTIADVTEGTGDMDKTRLDRPDVVRIGLLSNARQAHYC